MSEVDLFIFRMSATATLPKRGSLAAVGYDLYADLAEGKNDLPPDMLIFPGDRLIISTGIAAAIPVGYYGRVAPRSGLAAKFGAQVLGGVVDPDYRGEIKVMLLNSGNEDLIIAHGDRIAQLILEKVTTPEVVEVFDIEHLGISERGAAGFGSTGMK